MHNTAQMALIERITLPASNFESDVVGAFPGLRISIRSTTSSMSDYPEWRVEELRTQNQETVVTDGSCS
jgi:hypothetical protein